LDGKHFKMNFISVDPLTSRKMQENYNFDHILFGSSMFNGKTLGLYSHSFNESKNYTRFGNVLLSLVNILILYLDSHRYSFCISMNCDMFNQFKN
jgi:hypothetical protein